MKQFEYFVRRKQDLVTTIREDLVGFTTDFLNELGQNGEEVVTLSESQEPSQITDTQGRHIPYYVIIVLTKKEIEAAPV